MRQHVFFSPFPTILSVHLYLRTGYTCFYERVTESLWYALRWAGIVERDDPQENLLMTLWQCSLVPGGLARGV